MFKDKQVWQEIERLKNSIAGVSMKLDWLTKGLGAERATVYGRMTSELSAHPHYVPTLKDLEKLKSDFNLLVEHLGVQYFDYPASRQVRQTKSLKEKKK